MSQKSAARDDERLADRARAGDATAQEAIYRRNAPAVFSLALRLMGQRAAAEEVLQETFIKVLTRLESFRGEAALATWIRRVAVNECLQLLRSPWRRRGESFEDAAVAAERPDQTIDLERALARLPNRTRAVVWLHDVEGYTHRRSPRRWDRASVFRNPAWPAGTANCKRRLAQGTRAHHACQY